MKEKLIKRFKNPYFVIGIIALFLNSTQITPESLTSWSILRDQIVEVFSNPFLVGTFIVALVGQFVDPTTKGFKDAKDKESK